MSNDKLYESVGNYTKYKLVEMLIEKYKDKNMDNLNQIEQLADDVIKVLSIAGLKYYLVEYNPDIYWAVHKFGDEKIKKLWRKYLVLDAIWFPSATQKIELQDVVKRLKKYANEKIKKTGKASTKKKN